MAALNKIQGCDCVWCGWGTQEMAGFPQRHNPSFTSNLACGELGPNLGVRGLEVDHRGTSDLVASSGTGLNLWENLVMYGKTLPCVVTVTRTQHFPIERAADE